MNRTNTPFALVFALWIAGLGAAAQFGKISITFDLLRQAYPAAGPALGFLVSLVAMVGMLLGVVAGLLAARLGLRRVLLAALLLGAVLSAWQATLPPLGWFLASRVLEGLSQVGLVVSAPVLIAQISAPRHQGFTMTLWAGIFGVSFALTAWLGLPLAEARGPGALFAVHAGVMALMAGVLALMLPRDPPAPKVPLSLPALLSAHLEVYRSPRVAAPAAGFVFYTLMFVALLTLLPDFVPEGQRALFRALMPLASMAVSLVLGVQLLRWIPAVRVVQIGLALGIVAALGLWLVQGQVLAFFLLSLGLSGGMGLVQGGSYAAIPQLNAEASDRARAAGAVAQMGNLGNVLGTPILALLISLGGMRGVLAFVLPFCAAGILMHQWMLRRRQRGAALAQAC
ncbi:MFS transporter [Phaeovulum sp. W22_SRMD_FR3]|uniref:MFS transporter n=1 Tax=Phaeovulum sp. W22_SRMD_FR3 TaxID=3240274 RepID=UPI003F95A2F0